MSYIDLVGENDETIKTKNSVDKSTKIFLILENGRTIILKYCTKLKTWILTVVYTAQVIVSTLSLVTVPNSQVVLPIIPIQHTLVRRSARIFESNINKPPVPIVNILDSSKLKIQLNEYEVQIYEELFTKSQRGEFSIDDLEKLLEIQGGYAYGIAFIILALGLGGLMAFCQYGNMAEAFTCPNKAMDSLEAFYRSNPFQRPQLRPIHPKCGNVNIHRSQSMTILGLADEPEFEKLSKKEQRNAPHLNDKVFKGPNDEKFYVRYGQSKFKVKKHGALADCYHDLGSNDGTKTPRTEENIEKFQQTIVDICTDPKSSWYDNNSKYIVPLANNEERIFNSINVYNAKRNLIAVFEKEMHNFITLCQPDNIEFKKLEKTGDFIANYTGKAKNLPPETTPINSFENDILNITPITGNTTIDKNKEN